MDQTPESGVSEAGLKELASLMPKGVERVDGYFMPNVTLERYPDGRILVTIDWTDSYQGAQSKHDDGTLTDDEETIERGGHPYEVSAELMDLIMTADRLSFDNRNRTVLYETGEDGARRGSAARGGGK
jgi:hypothetical protein